MTPAEVRSHNPTDFPRSERETFMDACMRGDAKWNRGVKRLEEGFGVEQESTAMSMYGREGGCDVGKWILMVRHCIKSK